MGNYDSGSRIRDMIELECFLGGALSFDEEARSSRWPVEGYHFPHAIKNPEPDAHLLQIVTVNYDTGKIIFGEFNPDSSN